MPDPATRRYHRTFISRRPAALFTALCLLAAGSVHAQPAIELDVAPLHQNDYPDRMDNSTQTIAGSGCSLTAQTMVINHALVQEGLHEKKPDGSPGETIRYTPSDINRLLNDYRYQQPVYKTDAEGHYVKENGRYVVERVETKNGWGVTIGADGTPQGSSTSINMGALRKAVKADTQARSFEGQGLNVTRTYAPSFSGGPEIGDKGVVLDQDFTFILDQLEAGRPVVVRVKNNTHSVVITSYHPQAGQPRGTGRYDLKDPWRKADGTSILWLDDEEYRNLVFDYGANVYQAGGEYTPFAVPSEFYIDPAYLDDAQMNPDRYGPQLYLDNHTVPEPATLLLFGLGLLGAGLKISRAPSVRKKDCCEMPFLVMLRSKATKDRDEKKFFPFTPFRVRMTGKRYFTTVPKE